MSVTFGVHLGPSNLGVDELLDHWTHIEALPFDWISVWDHFMALNGEGFHCLESIATHTALALSTNRVRVGCLVYCAGYRHPAVLANAMATIDHLSGGRCQFGIGAGWEATEYAQYGMEFPRAGVRLDIMEESLRCVRGLLRNDTFSFEGRHFTMVDARCEPKPVQTALPLWVGGGGEKRTLRIAAELADGWNVPFVSPATFAAKRQVLERHCADFDRDPSEIRCSVNVGYAADEESMVRQFGALADYFRPGVVSGTGQQLTDALGGFIDAGADQINLALRSPVETGALDALADVIPTLTSSRP